MNSKQLVIDVCVGLFSGIMRVVSAIATATLLFPLSMPKYFPAGVTVCIITVMAPNLIAALRNRVPYVTWSRDYTPIFLFSVVGAQLFKALPAGEFAPTMIAFIMVSTVVTGVTFYLVGQFKLSNVARFVPFPVVAGFMAGIALLIIRQGLANLAGMSVTPGNAARLMAPSVMMHWIPGVLFALVMLFGGRPASGSIFRPLVIVATIAIFPIILAVTHTPILQAQVAGWSAPAIDGRLPLAFYLADVWQPGILYALGAHFNFLLTVVGVSLLSILLALAGLEVATRQDLQFERELKDAGLANIASGLLGGSIAYQSVRNTMTNYNVGGRTRLVPFATAGVGFIFLAFGWGTGGIGYLPMALVCGLVLYAGLDAARTWILDSRRRMSGIEYAVLVAIAVATVLWGILIGMTIGIVIAILLFAINYSQLRCIELRQTGRSLRSKVERPGAEDAILRRYDDQLRLFRLQGYLFFGSAEKIGETVTAEMHQRPADSRIPLCVMLDFRAVSGIDSSAMLAFSRILDTAQALGVNVMFIHLGKRVANIMAGSMANLNAASIYPDLDVALEARESSILGAFANEMPRRHNATDTLRQYLPTNEDVKALSAFFDIQEVSKGEILFTAGDPANSMMIVDAGEFEVYRDGHDGELIRLRKVKAGAILGEMGIYLRGHRTASVRAMVDSRVLVLDDTGLALMHETAADLALKFNRFIIGVLAERLSHSNNEVLELSSNTP